MDILIIPSLLVVGVLGAANLIIARKPEAQRLIAKIAPYQGWIGVGALGLGLTEVTWCLFDIGAIVYMPVYWISWLLSSLLLVALGILLGIGTIKMFVKRPEAVEKMDRLVASLAPKQGILGFAAIGVGTWMIVASIFFTASAYDAVDDWAKGYAGSAQALAAAQIVAQQQALAQQQAPAQQQALAQQQAPAQQLAPVAAPPAAAGIMATALVQQIWAAGVDVQQRPLLGMDLYVTPPGGAPYQVRLMGFPVPPAKQAMVAPNATINVSIDPANPLTVTPIL